MNKDSVRGERKLTEIITKVPTYKDAYLTAASLYVAKGNEQKALNILDKGLDRYPGEYQMLAKKLDILALTRDYANADKQADRLLRTFPKDSSVLKKYVDYHNEAGNYYLKHGGLDKAFSQFEMALGTSPRNTQAIEGSLSAILLQGNDQNSLAFINQLLAKHPESYELWMKKLGLLQQMRRYPEALESLQQMQKSFLQMESFRSLARNCPWRLPGIIKKWIPIMST
ncbi:tetratricopeptide repeat protein [Arachidicoccus ginsenosidivorans]|uniref:tetratricopeptide repeat protein n=1 Tax=Arachidicoccus ginsenosidivorans TaxID=496057 RepID=UPI0013152A99|nr:tetratricopeptide repeat protein [Arachidicoccus ginsenosidivorans]